MTVAERIANARILFEPIQKTVESAPGETVLDSARRSGVRISNACGGRGVCKACTVRFTAGNVPQPSEADRAFFSDHDLANGWRRACQVVASEDVSVFVPPRSSAEPSRTQVDSFDTFVKPDPAVRAYAVSLTPATIADAIADGDRLIEALNAKWPGICHNVDARVLRSLPHDLRKAEWRVQAAIRFGEIVAVHPRGHRRLGLAVDLGTTNIGLLLVDLKSGKTLLSRGVENPQRVHGGDLISRAAFARKTSDGLKTLHDLVIGAINEQIEAMCAECGAEPSDILDVVLAGNTLMHHLFLLLPVDHLCVAPFAPVMRDAMDLKTADIGLKVAPGAYIHAMANIAGYVGGDHTAVLLAMAADVERRTVVALDMGTNTEVSLIHEGRILSLSCPSGPAFEGGQISCGMRAAAGAIEAVSVDGGELTIKTIDDAPAVGICGSGVLDIPATLHRAGILDDRGRLDPTHPRVRGENADRAFFLCDDPSGEPIVFSQWDIRAVQLAKSAIRAGIDVLLERAGIEEDAIDQIVIAGAFGHYISLASARGIGLFPDLSPDKFSQIGNAAGFGAKRALLSYPDRAESRSIASRSEYVELAGSSGFMRAFMNRMNFPRKKQEQ